MTFAPSRDPVGKPRLGRFNDWFHPDGKVPTPVPGSRKAKLMASLATPTEQLRTEQNRYYELKRETNLPFVDAAVIEKVLVSTCTISTTSSATAVKEQRERMGPSGRRRLPSLTPVSSVGTPSQQSGGNFYPAGSDRRRSSAVRSTTSVALDAPPSSDSLFVPTLSMLRTLNAYLQQQADLAALLQAKYIPRRDAIIHVIRTETCCAALGLMNRGVSTNQKELLRSMSISSSDARSDGPLSNGSVTMAPQAPRPLDREAAREGPVNKNCCSSASHRRLAALIQQLDLATDDVVTLILLWRRNLSKPVPFLVQGENYLLRIKKEIDTVIGPAHRHMIQAAKDKGIYNPEQTQHSFKSLRVEDPPDENEFYQSYYLSRVSRRDVIRRASRSVRAKVILDDLRYARRQTQTGELISPRSEHELDQEARLQNDQKEVDAESVLTDIYSGSTLINTVFKEFDTQEAYLKEMLLRTAQGKYSFISHTQYIPSNPFQTDTFIPPPRNGGAGATNMFLSSPPEEASDAIITWLPFPVHSTVKLTDDELKQQQRRRKGKSQPPSHLGGLNSPSPTAYMADVNKYRSITLVNEAGQVDLSYMRHLFRPKASRANQQPGALIGITASLTSGDFNQSSLMDDSQQQGAQTFATVYGEEFNESIKVWLAHCYNEGLSSLESYFDDAFLQAHEEEDDSAYFEGHGNENNLSYSTQLDSDEYGQRVAPPLLALRRKDPAGQESSEGTSFSPSASHSFSQSGGAYPPNSASMTAASMAFDDQGKPLDQRERKLRKMEKRQHFRLRYHFFQKWMGLSLVRGERKKLAKMLLRKNERAHRRFTMAKWILWMERRRNKQDIAEKLEQLSERVLLKFRFQTLKKFLTLSVFGKSIHGRLYAPWFSKLYIFMIVKKLHKSRTLEADRKIDEDENENSIIPSPLQVPRSSDASDTRLLTMWKVAFASRPVDQAKVATFDKHESMRRVANLEELSRRENEHREGHEDIMWSSFTNSNKAIPSADGNEASVVTPRQQLLFTNFEDSERKKDAPSSYFLLKMIQYSKLVEKAKKEGKQVQQELMFKGTNRNISSSKKMPRAPPKGTATKKNVMGDHCLFYNGSTAKRFPMLAKVPQKELAAMFNVPMVYPEDLKAKEIEFAEPYNDVAYNFRPLNNSCKPFLPACSSEAKRSIAMTVQDPGDPFGEPVLAGTTNGGQGEDGEQQGATRNRQGSRTNHASLPPVKRLTTAPAGASRRPFRYGGAADAKQTVERRVYLNSLDEPTQAKLAEQIRLQIQDNREKLKSSNSAVLGKKPSTTGGGGRKHKPRSYADMEY